MQNNPGYEADTKNAYRNREKAASYKAQHQSDFSWARVTMWRELSTIKQMLLELKLDKNFPVLDSPCGAGVLASVVTGLGQKVIGSDISFEMIELALEEDWKGLDCGFLQVDATSMPFKDGSFQCILIIGLLHRLPSDLRIAVLKEAHRITNGYVIATMSLDTVSQKLKQAVIKLIQPSHKPAPNPATPEEFLADISNSGFKVKRKASVVPLLSADNLYLLEKE